MSAATDLVDLDRLEPWLVERGILVGPEPLAAAPLGEGHSNLTYTLSRGDTSLILRRPPRGPLLPTAHDVIREAAIMQLLDGQVPVPQVAGVCDTPDVIGAPFYLMQSVDGVVVRDRLPDFLGGAASSKSRTSLGIDVARVLGQIHRVPWKPFVAAGYGKESGYLERQLRRWSGQREGVRAAVAESGGRARDLPDYDVLRDWLVAQMPAEVEPTVVHGDYKLDNLIVRSAPEGHGGVEISAVIDWEMATVGDPRADLGYLLSFWPEPGEVLPLATLVTSAEGFPLRSEMIEIWEESSGRRIGDPRWFMAMAVWKLAILLEASYYRYLAGTADDPFFAQLELGVPALFSRARRIADV
ncbi:MAG: phosphotransferase family protein [Actinomycetes bacterium]